MAAFPSVDLTNFDLAPAARRTAELGKDVTFTAVGLGVLAYQRFQVRRREIERSLSAD